MNWAAISTVTVLLFLLGAGILLGWQLDYGINQTGNQLEIATFLKSGVEAESLLPLVEKLPGVAGLEVISKETAWAALGQDLGLENIKGVTEQLSGNPLVDEIRVKARSPEALPDLARQLKALQGVDDVRYLPDVLQQLNQLNQGLSRLGWGLVAMLTLAALAVITTTIRLIVIARQPEIEIQQLVGATSRWIALPFIFQGLAFGWIGGMLSWLLLLGLRQTLIHMLASQPPLIRSLVNAQAIGAGQQLLLPLMLLGFGGAVGMFGSLLAVQRSARPS
ncbi:MAG: ABC transporter permease [Synechococcales cyanobacterium RM1_1_8]|nr:ABC transporter permease [Synechococcales cyanobacterium RM1_1_8]